MSDVFVNIKDPDVWVRPAEWLPIDGLVSVGDHKFVGLLAVIPNQQNQIRVRVSSVGYTVDWGDGIVESYGSSVYSTAHDYDFSSVSSPLTAEGWKQVIITIYPTSPSTTFPGFVFVDQSTVAINNWLDIKFASSTCTSITIASIKRVPYLKKFVYAGPHVNMAINSLFTYANLEQFEMDLSNATTLASTFLGNAGGIFNNSNTNINSIANSLTSMFQASNVKNVGDISVTGSTALLQIFYQAQVLESVGNITAVSASNIQTIAGACTKLKTVGNINIPLATNAVNAFTGAYRLQTIGTITTGAGFTTMFGAFANCFSLQGVTVTNCSGLAGNGATNTFINCHALYQLSLPGIKLSFSIANTALQRDALVSLFNDLGTPATTQIITVTGTPGSPNLTPADILIATSKNWTVTL